MSTRNPYDNNLVDAALQGDTKGVEIYLKKGADINALDSNGTPVLLNLIQNNKLDMVKFLIQRGAKVDINGDGGSRMLCEAIQLGSSRDDLSDLEARKNNYEIIQLLLSKGANPNNTVTYTIRTNVVTSTPLTVAARRGNVALVKLLLDNGAGVDIPNNSDGRTAIHESIQWGFYNITHLLLKHGANLHTRDHSGRTPMITGIVQNIGNDAQYFAPLLSRPATQLDLKKSNELLLCYLDYTLAPAVNLFLFFNQGMYFDNNLMRNEINKLLEKSEKQGYTKYHKEQIEQLIFLTNNVEKLFAATAPGADSKVLKEALDLISTSQPHKLPLLPLNVRQASDGNTLLQLAILNGNQRLVEALINQNVNIDLRNHQGKTAWEMAKGTPFESLLLNKKLEQLASTKKPDYQTLSEYQKEIYEILSQLINPNNLNRFDFDGGTKNLLMYALANGNFAVAKWLMEQPNINIFITSAPASDENAYTLVTQQGTFSKAIKAAEADIKNKLDVIPAREHYQRDSLVFDPIEAQEALDLQRTVERSFHEQVRDADIKKTFEEGFASGEQGTRLDIVKKVIKDNAMNPRLDSLIPIIIEYSLEQIAKLKQEAGKSSADALSLDSVGVLDNEKEVLAWIKLLSEELGPKGKAAAVIENQKINQEQEKKKQAAQGETKLKAASEPEIKAKTDEVQPEKPAKLILTQQEMMARREQIAKAAEARAKQSREAEALNKTPTDNTKKNK